MSYNPKQARDGHGRWSPKGSAGQGPTVRSTMARYKAGKLRSGNAQGPVVQSRKQAFAIGKSVQKKREAMRRMKVERHFHKHHGVPAQHPRSAQRIAQDKSRQKALVTAKMYRQAHAQNLSLTRQDNKLKLMDKRDPR